MSRKLKRGAATVEMTLVGIPLIFTLISIFEISRGMWVYHTMAFAVKEGVRFASVHGLDCVNSPTVLNNCAVTVGYIASVIQQAGVGLNTTETTLTFCAPAATNGELCPAGGTTTTVFLNSTSSAQWPPTNFNGIGQTIEIDIKTPFTSALAMFWPGAHRVSFAVTQFVASSSANIQF